ncbi:MULTISPECIES: cyclase family protein [unclassified Nocardia]|uniref:cyclase family protein n=1 Tax=unclassified Nocardia TaxID=2637762 RepID=UPI001CE40883|nr:MULTISPECIES: cyclase family protein [unclassified Nocardia]
MFIDLSHPVTNGMTTLPGLPEPLITTHTSRRDGPLVDISYEIARVDLVGNTGTYVDSPFHFDADGADMADLPVERLLNVPIVMIRAADERTVGPDLLGDPARLWGKAVLVHTGWSSRWGSPAYRESDHPYLVSDLADALVAANVAVVGIDSLDIDDTSRPTRPVHHTLLGAGIPIIEHLTNLDRVPDIGARLTALPPPIRGMTSFPVRAIATVG